MIYEMGTSLTIAEQLVGIQKGYVFTKRRLRRNLLEWRDINNITHYRLYRTDVLSIWPIGRFRVNMTIPSVTTRRVINQYIPAGWRVFRKNNENFLFRESDQTLFAFDPADPIIHVNSVGEPEVLVPNH